MGIIPVRKYVKGPPASYFILSNQKRNCSIESVIASLARISKKVSLHHTNQMWWRRQFYTVYHSKGVTKKLKLTVGKKSLRIKPVRRPDQHADIHRLLPTPVDYRKER